MTPDGARGRHPAAEYALLFNTSDVRRALGNCSFPLHQQLVCAGGQLLPDGVTRAPAAPGYHPVFTVDASKMYSGSVGLALRSAELLAAASPNTKVVLLLRSPVELARAVYNEKLTQECGTHECGTSKPPFETLLHRELQFLNESRPAAAALARLLSNATRPGEARMLELHLQSNWTAYAMNHGWEPVLWGKSLYSLHGLYAPVVMTWVEKFVRPGRPLLVVQAEAFFERPAEVVDNVLGPFLFGDPAGMAAFQAPGPAPAASPAVAYGAKAAQSVASRCALYETLAPANRALERMLNAYAKQGRVQLVRLKREGPLWPRPADCKALRNTNATVATAGDYDYAVDYSEPPEFMMDYDYSYEFDDTNAADYDGGSPPKPSPPPPRVG